MVASIGNVRPVRIEEELKSSYLDYAMSVIVARALPDVRDGLKPVQRRILYAMDELGMRPNTAYKKSARLVGEVLGKFHPHGDAPVYEAMVRLAQTFTMRYPLIDGQGNFGSIDDDPPAAMRYTEARMAPIALELLANIEQETVDFTPNFDGSLHEPLVLPARLPNLLVNGSSGIAVGMATSILPHNLSEVCDAVIHLIDHPDAEISALLSFIQGPDFPTGGILMTGPGRHTLWEAYEKGQGRALVRARAEVQEIKRSGRSQIVVTEVPYQVNKAALVEKIARLARDKKIEGITEVRDESSREGLRVVIELRGSAHPDIVLRNLYKHTALQMSFTVNMVALVDGQPKVLSLAELLRHFIQFRTQVVTRRARFDLRKAQERAHILEGLRIALSALDEVVQIIRRSADVDSARQALINRFQLTYIQAQAILDMQLRRLTALDSQRLEEEYQGLQRTIVELQALLADPQKVMAVVRQETLDLKEEFGDLRRTTINEDLLDEAEPDLGKLIQPTDIVVTMSRNSYIKAIPLSTYRLQSRGGKGVIGITTREDDVVQYTLVANTHDTLFFFTDRGRVISRKCYEIHADTSRTTRGTPVFNVLPLAEGEHVTSIIPMRDLTLGKFLLLATRKGAIKRIPMDSLASIRPSGLIAMRLKGGDELFAARAASEDDEVILVSEKGMAIRFPANQVPVRSRAAGGVRAVRLAVGDQVVGIDVAVPGGRVFTITNTGFGKLTDVKEFRSQARGGKGLLTHRLRSAQERLAAALVVVGNPEMVVATTSGMVQRTTLEKVATRSRKTHGVYIMRFERGDDVVSVAAMAQSPQVAAKPQPPQNERAR